MVTVPACVCVCVCVLLGGEGPRGRTRRGLGEASRGRGGSPGRKRGVGNRRFILPRLCGRGAAPLLSITHLAEAPKAPLPQADLSAGLSQLPLQQALGGWKPPGGPVMGSLMLSDRPHPTPAPSLKRKQGARPGAPAPQWLRGTLERSPRAPWSSPSRGQGAGRSGDREGVRGEEVQRIAEQQGSRMPQKGDPLRRQEEFLPLSSRLRGGLALPGS